MKIYEFIRTHEKAQIGEQVASDRFEAKRIGDVDKLLRDGVIREVGDVQAVGAPDDEHHE